MTSIKKVKMLTPAQVAEFFAVDPKTVSRWAKEGKLPARQSWFTAPIYRSFLDPDGRPLDMRLRRTY